MAFCQHGILSTCCFINLLFRQLTAIFFKYIFAKLLVLGHFVNLPFCQLAIASTLSYHLIKQFCLIVSARSFYQRVTLSTYDSHFKGKGAMLGKSNVLESCLSYAALFTILVRWHISAVIMPPLDVIFG
jgi:hypothetical protein